LLCSVARRRPPVGWLTRIGRRIFTRRYAGRPQLNRDPLGGEAEPKVNLEDFGNLGDFLGGIGVIVTLAYLAVQIRSNTQTVRAASLEAVVNSHSQFLDRLAATSELSRIWFSGIWAGAELPPEDGQRLLTLLFSAVRRWESAFHNVRTGTIEHSSWEGLHREYTNVFASPGARARWPLLRVALSSAFLPFAEEAIRQHHLVTPLAVQQGAAADERQ